MSFSQADYLAMLAKLNRGKATQEEISGVSPNAPESELHDKIIHHCKMVNWIYFHGSMTHKAMRTVGEPDFVILASKGRVFFIECKTKMGKLSTEQLGLKLWAEKLGHQIHTVRSFEEFVSVVTGL